MDLNKIEISYQIGRNLFDDGNKIEELLADVPEGSLAALFKKIEFDSIDYIYKIFEKELTYPNHAYEQAAFLVGVGDFEEANKAFSCMARDAKRLESEGKVNEAAAAYLEHREVAAALKDHPEFRIPNQCPSVLMDNFLLGMNGYNRVINR